MPTTTQFSVILFFFFNITEYPVCVDETVLLQHPTKTADKRYQLITLSALFCSVPDP